MPSTRFVQALLAGLAATTLVGLALWAIDATYLRHGAELTYAAYYPRSPAPAAAVAPAIVAPHATHPGVIPREPPPTRPAAAPAPAAPPTAREADLDDHVIVDRRVERTPQLYTVVRAQARVLNAWDFHRLGPITERPRVFVRARARVLLDRASAWRFEVRGMGRGLLTIDGIPVVTLAQTVSTPIALARGEHDFDLAWRIETPRDYVVTYAAPARSPLRPLAASTFRPPPDATDDARTRAWWLGLAVALGAGLLVAGSFAARDATARRRRGSLAAALAIVLVGIGLRAWDYDVVPQYGQIGDELFATWNGWSMIAEGKTRGWSLWPTHYGPRVEVRRLRFLGQDWNVVSPYFEHPPLMHLLVGAAAHLGGARHWLQARITHTRLVPVGLSSLAVLLVMLLARKLDRRPAVALLAGALHAVLPLTALQARLVKEDHLLTVLLLGAVLAALTWTERRHIGWLVLASVLAGLAPLAKLPGVAAIAVVFCLAWAGGRLRSGLGALAIALPVASLLGVHGALFGWDAFLHQTLVQGTIRGGTWSIFVNWFEFARIGDNDVGRGWLLLLWLGYFTGFPSGRLPRVAYLLPVVLHLAATAVASSWMYGWYLLPLYPFLCIGAARSLTAAWDTADGWRAFVAAALGPMYALQLMQPLANPQVIKLAVAATVLVLVTPLVLHTVLRARVTAQLVRAALALGLVFLALTAALFVVTYDIGVLSAANFDSLLRR